MRFAGHSKPIPLAWLWRNFAPNLDNQTNIIMYPFSHDMLCISYIYLMQNYLEVVFCASLLGYFPCEENG